jgi:hypothetical protein
MVNSSGTPLQVTVPTVNEGITLKSELTEVFVVLIAVKLKDPIPEKPDPIEPLLLVQENSVAVPENSTLAGALLHSVRSDTGLITGEGFTVIVKVWDGPLQF